MGQSFKDRVIFLGAIFATSCVIAAYWTLIPIAAQMAGMSK